MTDEETFNVWRGEGWYTEDREGWAEAPEAQWVEAEREWQAMVDAGSDTCYLGDGEVPDDPSVAYPGRGGDPDARPAPEPYGWMSVAEYREAGADGTLSMEDTWHRAGIISGLSRYPGTWADVIACVRSAWAESMGEDSDPTDSLDARQLAAVCNVAVRAHGKGRDSR